MTEEVGVNVVKRSRRRPSRPQLVNPYAVVREPSSSWGTAAAGAAVAGAAGLVVLGAGPAAAEERQDPAFGPESSESGESGESSGGGDGGGGEQFVSAGVFESDLLDGGFDVDEVGDATSLGLSFAEPEQVPDLRDLLEPQVEPEPQQVPDLGDLLEPQPEPEPDLGDLPEPEAQREPERQPEPVPSGITPAGVESGPDLAQLLAGVRDREGVPAAEGPADAGDPVVADAGGEEGARTEHTGDTATPTLSGLLGGPSEERSGSGDGGPAAPGPSLTSGPSEPEPVPEAQAVSVSGSTPGEDAEVEPGPRPVPDLGLPLSEELPRDAGVEPGRTPAPVAGANPEPGSAMGIPGSSGTTPAGVESGPDLVQLLAGVRDREGEPAAEGPADAGDPVVPEPITAVEDPGGDSEPTGGSTDGGSPARLVPVPGDPIQPGPTPEEDAVVGPAASWLPRAAGFADIALPDFDPAAGPQVQSLVEDIRSGTVTLSTTSSDGTLPLDTASSGQGSVEPTRPVGAGASQPGPGPGPEGSSSEGSSGEGFSGAAPVVEAAGSAGSGVSDESVQGSPPAGGPAAQRNVETSVELDANDVPVAGTDTLPLLEPAIKGSAVADVPGDGAMAVGAAGSGDTGVTGDVAQESAAVEVPAARGNVDASAEDVGEEQRALSLDELLAGVGAAGTVGGVGEDVPGGVEATVGGAFVPGEVSLPEVSQPGESGFAWSVLPGSADVLPDGAELGFAEGTDLSQLRFAPGDVAGFEGIEGVLGTGDVGGSDAGAALAAALGITPDGGADPGGPDSTVDAAFGAAEPPSDPGTSALLDTREGGDTSSAVPTTAGIATSRSATPGSSPQGPATTGATPVPTSAQLPGLAPWSQPGVPPTVGAARTPATGGRPGVAGESAPAPISTGGDSPAATGGTPARSAGDGDREDGDRGGGDRGDEGERGDRTNPVRDLLTAIGRTGIGVAHLGAAPFSDGFRSQESLFFDEPSQVQRARDSFGTAREAVGRLIPGDEPEQAPQVAATDADDQDEDEERPWRITTFDEENWPPQFELEPRQLAFAALGILPTVGLTANQRAIANRTSTAQELLPSTATLPRSVASDIALGGLPIEVFEGDTQNALGGSLVSGTVIAGMDEVARTASRNLPEIQRRNNEFWLNRGNRPNQYAVSRAPGTPQLSSGLARPTVFSIAPSVTAFNLAADAVTDRFDIDPEPTDENNNRYYAELLTDSLATGAGVFLPIAGENYLSARAAALRAGTPVPRVGNVAAQTALAFGLPVAQTFAAGILTEEPPDTTDPIYRGTRAAFQYIADDVAEVNDSLLGEAREEDGNDANATRAVGNAVATVATPVLDAVGGIAPNAVGGLGDSWNYVMTGERIDPRPVVSDEALASAEESRARAQRAWELSREGAPNSGTDAAVQAGSNLLYSVGRGTIGLVHSAARIADPFQSEESRFLLEPTQRERAAESFDRAGQAWEQAGNAINYLRGRSPADEDSTEREGDRPSVPAGSGVSPRTTVTGSPNEESRSRSGFPICSDAGQIECVEPGSLDLDDPASVGSVRVGSGGVRSANSQTGRVTEFPVCSVTNQVDCVDPDTIDLAENRIGEVVRGNGGEVFVDPGNSDVRRQYPTCSVAFQVDCVVEGTRQRLVGGGRPTRISPEGLRVEVPPTVPELQEQYRSMTPRDYQRAFEQIDDRTVRRAAEAGVSTQVDRAGRQSVQLRNPVAPENLRSTVGGIVDAAGNQFNRARRAVGNFLNRF